ncbi:MAG TPA: PspC domain-containing protein [Flavobacterium sp.]|nr:PspC domain-containing protein [Flavobacterium sp.]
MNKTVTINIAGLVFHIDEDAYNKLDSYINAVRRSIQQEGEDEIIADIEARIAELFSERIDPQSGVIRMNNVDEIINIMGKPEDYIIDEETNTSHQYTYSAKQAKKVYRDGEKRILGGVCSGLGHYLNVDPVWIRIIFLLLLFLYGTSVLVYFILWIIIPKARTVADVLEMKGEAVNISSIEKQFREGISNSYQTLKTNGKSAADIIRKVIGISLIIFSFFGIFGSFFAPIAFNSEFSHLQSFGINITEAATGIPFWGVSLCLFIMCVIPFIVLLLLGVKLINPKIRYIGLTSAILGFLWLAAIFIFSYSLINGDFAYSKIRSAIEKDFDKKLSKTELYIKENDTLNLTFERDSRIFTINDTITNGYKYSEIEDVDVEILETNNGKSYIEIEEKVFNKSSNYSKSDIKLLGIRHTIFENIEYSNTLNYHYSIKNNTLALSNTILTTKNDFTEDSEVNIKIYILPSQTVKVSGKDYYNYIGGSALQSGTHYYKFNNEGKLTNTKDTIN